DPARGNVLAACAGLTCGLMLLGLRWLERAHTGSAATAVVVGNTIAFLGTLPWAPPAVHVRMTDALIVAYLGVFQIGFGYLLLLWALRKVGALEATLLLFVEPVLSPIWSWLVHGERPGAWSWAGGVLILAATAVKTWADLALPSPAAAALPFARAGDRRTGAR